jgi:hypothetical protein
MHYRHLLALGLMAALASPSCSASDSIECSALTGNQYLDMAREAKHGMLQRSRAEEQRNFRRDEAVLAGIGPTANGHAAIVDFTGQDGRRLTALIHDDCYIGWTGGPPRSGPLSTVG